MLLVLLIVLIVLVLALYLNALMVHLVVAQSVLDVTSPRLREPVTSTVLAVSLALIDNELLIGWQAATL